jgi:IS30 family transposase
MKMTDLLRLDFIDGGINKKNINVLIRQFLTKGMDLSQVSQSMLNRISFLLNNRVP